jgi:hypothetical protein
MRVMNCLEFRRTVGADPGANDPVVLQHAEECVACKRYREELQRMDQLIHRALLIEVDTPSARTPSRFRWLSRPLAAASVAAAFVLSALVWLWIPRETLAEQVVEHVEHEPQSLVVTDSTVEPEKLNDVLARSRVLLKPGAGRISYAASCWFRGHYVPHLVVQSDEGPVTVLLLTHSERVERREVFQENGFEGVILPAPRGAIAVLAQDARVEQVAERFLQSVEYRR